MTTQNKENYGRDVRSFHHPEDDMRPISDINSQNFANESYVDQYEKDNDDDEEIVNQDDDIVNNEDDELNNQFINALERDNEYVANYLDEDNDNSFYADEWDDETDLNDIDDDLEEDYDENHRDINDFATDNYNNDLLDLEYDIDQDLEETDPVNHPRNFKY